MKNPADTFGPYELWESNGAKGAEFRYLDSTAEPPKEERVRIPTSSLEMKAEDREVMYQAILARIKPGTRFERIQTGWSLKRSTR
jgi:hypothetical protein